MQTLKSLFGKVGKKRDREVTRVEASDSGVVVWLDDGGTESLDWAEAELVYTYKVDCYAFDTIWLAFRGEGQREIHIREEADGFEQLMSSVNSAFPSIDREWYQTVTQPPFAENLTLLYHRQPEAEHVLSGTERPR
jgi:hypothetical protein